MKQSINNPFVSVIMPVYNPEQYISISVKSILNQSYSNFEFIIIDDASIDETFKKLLEFKKKDKRIILVKNKKNEGVTKSLNKAIKEARGKYTIRMDADDWSYPDRFKFQVELMENNPDVVVSGSYVEICNSKLKMKNLRQYHLDDATIRKHIFRYSPFAHPATIWKTKVLKENLYNEVIIVSQDYELYFRVGKMGKFMNLNKPLLKLRMHNNSVSASKSGLQWNTTVLIRFNAILMHGYEMSKFDKLYNFLQEIGIGLLPTKMRFLLFNFLRKYSLY